MAIERTLSIVKPDGVERNLIGEIFRRFEAAELRLAATRKVWLSQADAEGFYRVHRERPFFDSLIAYMTSGPVVVSVLEGEDAIGRHRQLLGATNPTDAAEGTIRADFGQSIEVNTVHGSDAPDTAAFEIGWFFRGSEIY